MAFGATYNPASVMMGRPSGGSSPYLWTGAGSKPPMPGPQPLPKSGPYTDGPGMGGTLAGPIKLPLGSGGSGPVPPVRSNFGSNAPAVTPSGPTGILAPRNVRATGTGPFDPAYRQNLASYAGGQFSGNLSFNPTDINSFPGQPTGGGTAPVTGMPTSLMDMALAGQGFSWMPHQPAQTATKPPNYADMQQWMDQFMKNGRGLRMGSIA